MAILGQAWYQAAIPLPFLGFKPYSRETLELTFGKMDIFGFFDQNAAAGDEAKQFLNSVFVHNPLLDAGREAGFAKPRTEGEENGEWIIVDCGAAVVHVMQPAIRQYYRLEEIWGEKPVRLKLAAAKPRKITASSEEDAAPAAKKVAKKAAAPRAKAASAALDATATPAPAKKRSPRSAAAPQASQPSAAVKKAPAKKAAAAKRPAKAAKAKSA